MGRTVPVTREDTGKSVGIAMVINTENPGREFNVLAKVDGVLVGMVITDPELIRKIQGDNLGAFSITPKTMAQVIMEFAKYVEEIEGQTMARGMQCEIDADFDSDGYLRPYGDIYSPDYATRHTTRFIPNHPHDGIGEFIEGMGD